MAGWLDPAGIHTGVDFYRQIVESTHDCVKVREIDGPSFEVEQRAQYRNACGPTPLEHLFASEAKRTSGLTKEQR